MLNALEDGRGGLEHRSSTALRRAAPRPAATRPPAESGSGATARPETSDGYVGVLGPDRHEYFHAWNVKRLKPREFAAFDYGRENYTELLWFFEGFTSYYDDLFVLRSGLIDAARYLKLLATTIDRACRRSPGRAVQSVAAASFDAWVKYYRADENTPERDDQLLRQGLAGRARPRPDAAQRRPRLARRGDAPALAHERRRPDRRGRHRRRARGGRRPLVRSASSPPGCTAPTSCRSRRCCALRRRAAHASRRRWRSASACASPRARSPASRSPTSCAAAPASAPASRRATRSSRSAAGACAGSTMPCARLPPDGDDAAARRPRPARRSSSPCRPRRSPANAGAVQLRPLDAAAADARRLYEAWLAG